MRNTSSQLQGPVVDTRRVPSVWMNHNHRRWTTLEQSGSWEMREDLDTAAGLPSAQQKV